MTDRVVNKIKKLLALSESSNEHEAALAAERAQELMIKHGIELASIQMGEDRAIGVDRRIVEGMCDPWRRSLAHAVARGLGGDFVYEVQPRKWRGEIEFFGQAGTVDGMVAMYQALEAQLVHISALAMSAREDKSVNGMTWRRSFLMGAVRGIQTRLVDRRNKVYKDTRGTDNHQALVLARDAVRDAIKEAYPNTVSNNYRPDIDPGAFKDGRDHGERMDLGDSRIATTKGALPRGTDS